MRSIIHDAVPEMKSNPSEELKELLGNMLSKNPSKRLTIQQFLEHKWVKGM
jgi:hypothetical protein